MDIEIYEQAHEIMKSRRRKAKDELDDRINEINQKIPEIQEINNTIFNSGKEIIQIIMNARGRDIKEQIETLKKRNIEAKEISKNLLAAYKYPSDYLEIHYTCPKCEDTGYINENFCDCMKSLFGKLMTEKINSNSQIALSSFDTFRLDYYANEDYQTMQRIFEFSRRYAENFTINSENIIMTGDTGLGKTHLSLAIANTVIQKGFNVIYDSAINILWTLEREHYNYDHSTDFFNAVLDADLIIIDDLGTEQETKFNVAMVYNIINTRLTKGKPTIISTNLSHKNISEKYGGKVSSRITTQYKYLQFCGKDVRLQIFREKNMR